MNTMTTINIEAARQAAIAMVGLGPDPRDPLWWNTYACVEATAFATLLDALGVPRFEVRGSILGSAQQATEEGSHE
jgi:hypothetical protein